MDQSIAAPKAVADLDLPQLDVFAPDADHDELQARRLKLAAQHWLVQTPLGYLALRYDDVASILRDKRWHSASGQLLAMAGITEDPERKPSILAAEGDEHTRLRRLIAKAFTPRSADRFRPFMREVIDGLVDRVSAAGSADFASDIAEPYPIPIICELLGAPQDDLGKFSHWATEIFKLFNLNLHEDYPAIKQAIGELDDYTRGLIATRRDRPAEDLLTELIAAEEQGDRLDTDELVSVVEAVILAGTDTTRNQLGMAVATFARHREQWKLLAEQPELAPQAVEEVMRYAGAVRGTARIASDDIVYRDVLFPQGTFLGLSFNTSNRDDAAFPDRANTFDITKQPGAQSHLTFGGGIHFCVGSALARAELQEALPLLARRLPELEIVGDVTWKSALSGIFGPSSLPISFDPGH